MIVIKLYSFELTDEELYKLGALIAEYYGKSAFTLALAADPVRGRQIELLITDKPLAP